MDPLFWGKPSEEFGLHRNSWAGVSVILPMELVNTLWPTNSFYMEASALLINTSWKLWMIRRTSVILSKTRVLIQEEAKKKSWSRKDGKIHSRLVRCDRQGRLTPMLFWQKTWCKILFSKEQEQNFTITPRPEPIRVWIGVRKGYFIAHHFAQLFLLKWCTLTSSFLLEQSQSARQMGNCLI